MASTSFQRLATFFVTLVFFSTVAFALPIAAAEADAALAGSFLSSYPTNLTLLIDFYVLAREPLLGLGLGVNLGGGAGGGAGENVDAGVALRDAEADSGIEGSSSPSTHLTRRSPLPFAY